MTSVHVVYVGGMRTMNKRKKYTYTQIVKTVGYKIAKLYDDGEISLGMIMDIYEQKLKEKN